MADPTKIPSLNPLIDKADTEALKDYLNLQSEMEESIKKQNNSLFDQLGIRKDLSFSIREYFIKVNELSKHIDHAKNREKELTEELVHIVEETQRRSQLQTINSIKQRRESYEAELQLLEQVKAYGLLPIIWGLSKAFQLFKSLDKSAWEFRRVMGMTRDSAELLRRTIQDIAIDYTHVGVTADGAAAAMMALGVEMGSVRAVTKDLVKTTAVLKSQLGIAEEDTAGFLKNMAAISNSTMKAQENLAYIAADLSMAAGVPLPLIMKDLATKSGTTLTMMSRLPNQIARAAIELRKMGTSLDQAAKSSREILNFSDNINAEMEAAVLLGRSINLHRARELAYQRDLEGSTREILKLTNQIDFSKLDVFQQESFARATGKSVDELMQLVQAEKQWKAARSTPELAGQVVAYEQLKASNQSIAKSNAENLKLMIEQKSNQERLTAITQKWNAIISKAAAGFLPIIDGVLSIVPPMIEFGVRVANVLSIVWSVGKAIEVIGLNLAMLTEKTAKISNIFLSIAGIGNKILTPIVKLGSLFAKIGTIFARYFPLVAKFISPFFKLLGPIGLIITAFQAIGGFISGWNSSSGSFGEKLKSAFLGTLRAIIPGFDWISEKLGWIASNAMQVARFMFKWLSPIGFLINGFKYLFNLFSKIAPSLISAFDNAWNGIKDWLGFSPSKIGLSIVKGILSVGPMLFDALTSPFRNGLSWILDKLPGMGKVAEKLRLGMSGLINKPIETRISGDTTSVLTPSKIKVANDVTSSPSTSQSSDNNNTAGTSSDILLTNILNAINVLNKNLENGKIGFYVDGQLLSATLARQTDFRNGYGVNKAR